MCERMRQVGIQPDTITANQQLAAAGASGRTGTVRELLAGMVAAAAGTARNDEKGGQRWTAATAGAVPPTDAFTFSAAFRAAAAAPGAYSGDWLLATWRAMAGARVAPNEHVLTSFLSAASAAELSPDELRAVFGIASDCRAAGLCGARGYAGLLALCAQHGVAERALDVWCAVQEVRGVQGRGVDGTGGCKRVHRKPKW